MMKLLIQCLAVGAAGFLGAVARFLLSGLIGRSVATRFPLGTFVINITGSFLLGWFYAFMQRRYPAAPEVVRLAVATGFLGAYTTFSTFTLEAHEMLDRSHYLTFALYAGGSVVIGLLACAAGVALGRA
jgi:CrcB protein